MIVSNVCKHLATLDDATKAYAKATSSSVRFLIAENECMAKELQAANQREEKALASARVEWRKEILYEISSLKAVMLNLYFRFVTMHKSVFHLNGWKQHCARRARILTDIHIVIGNVGIIGRQDNIPNNSPNKNSAEINNNVDKSINLANNPSPRLKTQNPHPKLIMNSDKAQVINLSDIILYLAAESILKKGLNFAITPNKIPIEEVISNIEVSIKNLEIAKIKEIGQDIAKILRTAKPPTSNISIEERRALNNLRKIKT